MRVVIGLPASVYALALSRGRANDDRRDFIHRPEVVGAAEKSGSVKTAIGGLQESSERKPAVDAVKIKQGREGAAGRELEDRPSAAGAAVGCGTVEIAIAAFRQPGVRVRATDEIETV